MNTEDDIVEIQPEYLNGGIYRFKLHETTETSPPNTVFEGEVMDVIEDAPEGNITILSEGEFFPLGDHDL